MKELGVLYQTPTIIPISHNYQLVCEEGMKMKVIIDCYDESYLHELFYHYREGLIEKKLTIGDEVEVIGCWKNLFGSYAT